MENNFIQYNEAKELKEIGFDEPCQSVFEINEFTNPSTIEAISTETKWDLDAMKKAIEFMERTGRTHFFNRETKNSQLNQFLIARPQYEDVFDWFSNTHHLHSFIYPVFGSGGKCGYDSFKLSGWNYTIIKPLNKFDADCYYLGFQSGDDMFLPSKLFKLDEDLTTHQSGRIIYTSKDDAKLNCLKELIKTITDEEK